MIVATWNVNGIRACVKKGFWEAVRKIDPDILCLQEVKSNEPVQTPLDKSYAVFWFPAEKKGYAGTGVITKIKPKRVKYGIDCPEFDSEGRVITLEFDDLFVVNAYFPHSQRGLERLEFKLRFDEKVENYVENLKVRKPVVFAGDFNVAHKEIDLARPKENEKNAGFTKEEREWFDRFLKKGWIDTFRYLHPNEVAYTWWSYRFNAREKNIGWRVDYILISENLKSSLKKAYVFYDTHASDHVPVVAELSAKKMV